MKRSNNLSYSEMRVGLIVGVSFLVSAMVIVAYGKIHNIFAPQVKLTALFHNVQGLTQGAPVRVLGIDSGYVSSVHFVRFSGDQYIRVAMRISRKRFTQLSSGTTASIHTQGLMGNKYVELSPGLPQEGALNASLPIIGVESGSIGQVMKSGNEVVTHLKSLSISLDELATQAKNGQGSVGQLLQDPSLYRNMNQLAAKLSDLTSRLESGRGTMSKLIGSSDLYNHLDNSLISLDRFIESVERGPGLSGSLVRDPGVARSFKESLTRLDQILTQIQSGKGVAGEILYNEEMAGRVNRTLDRVNDLLKDMKEHPKKYFTVEVHVF